VDLITVDTILIVDDDPNVRLMLQNILEGGPYELLTAKDGMEAQGVLRREGKRIGVVILDWSMPKMSGIELLRWIKEQSDLDHVPVVMHTVLVGSDQVKEGIDAGAFYYLPKPATEGVINSIVRAALADWRERKRVLEQLKREEAPFRTLLDGRFRFRTIAEGEQLAVSIANSCPEPQRAAMIMEMITNAIEHGNLGITYQEKTRFMEEGTWYAEIEQRLNLRDHASKYVDLHFKRHRDKITVLIEDCGNGFDFKPYLTLDEQRLRDNHGRGIAIARSYLDLEYQGAGNKVLVTIPCPRTAELCGIYGPRLTAGCSSPTWLDGTKRG
jgi:DNA-binding response OmpR family regulator